MIVPMKKASVIILAQDTQNTLKELRRLGVLHIEHQQLPQGKDITILKEEIVLLDEAIGILTQKEFCVQPPEDAKKEIADWRHIAQHVIDTHKRIEHLEEYASNLAIQMGQWGPWGDFAPEEIKNLREKGIYIKLYQIPRQDISELPEDLVIKTIFTEGGIAHCLVAGQKEFSLSFKEITLPRMGLAAMRKRLLEDKKVLEELKEDLLRLCNYYQGLIKIKKKLEKELELQEAMRGMGEAGGLAYVTGYIPSDTSLTLSDLAKQERWGIYITDPSEEDLVPTLIRNQRWVSFISPLFKILEIVPGYRELDISLSFLVFFSIFFGMLIGDAGYGLFYIAFTAFAQKKFAGKLKERSTFVLLYLLSFCAVAWGVLSGTYFGQNWLPAVVKPVIPALRNDKNTQAFCFFLGALHLSIAHSWRAVLKLPSLASLADIGWIIILWGSFFLARFLVLGDNFPWFGKWFFILGPVLVVLFTNPCKNILKGIGEGLSAFLLSAVNTFTDVVSYIRLFAVGLASIAVADAFNKMALDIGFNGIATGFIASLTLFLGHILNIVLGPMAVLVHGVRLNVLEFCGHAGIQWNGFAYRPLKENG